MLNPVRSAASDNDSKCFFASCVTCDLLLSVSRGEGLGGHDSQNSLPDSPRRAGAWISRLQRRPLLDGYLTFEMPRQGKVASPQPSAVALDADPGRRTAIRGSRVGRRPRR